MCRFLLSITIFAFLIGQPQSALSAEAGWWTTETSSGMISACAHVDYSIGISSGDLGTVDMVPTDFESPAWSSSNAGNPLLTVRRPVDYDVIMIVEIAGRSADIICLDNSNCDTSFIGQSKINENILLLRISEQLHSAASDQRGCVLTIITTDN
jgi:hypothetical protein